MCLLNSLTIPANQNFEKVIASLSFFKSKFTRPRNFVSEGGGRPSVVLTSQIGRCREGKSPSSQKLTVGPGKVADEHGDKNRSIGKGLRSTWKMKGSKMFFIHNHYH